MPLARFSNKDGIRTTFKLFANGDRAWVVGPGMVSARSKCLDSSVWQKYRVRKSSGSEMICAPFAAAILIPDTAFLRLSPGFLPQDIWINAIRTVFLELFDFMASPSDCFQNSTRPPWPFPLPPFPSFPFSCRTPRDSYAPSHNRDEA